MEYKINFNDTESLTLSTSDLKNLDIQMINNNEYHVLKDSKGYNVQLESFDPTDKILVFFINENKYTVKIDDQLDVLVSSMGFDIVQTEVFNEIKSPMPGVILNVLVKQGQEVEEGDQIIVLEAMKMENMIKSNGSGKILNIGVSVGDAVEKDQILISFEP